MLSAAHELWDYRALTWNFAQRDLKSKYKRSALGWSWSLVNPVATLAIYTLVFGIIFRAKPPALGNGDKGNYTLFLFTALVLWNFFSNTINGCMQALIGAGPLLRKIYFPAFTPVVGSVLATGIQTLIETGVVVAIMVALVNVSWTILLLPFVLLLLLLFALGLGLMLSVWNVYYRDVSYLVSLGLQILFYATPIIYPPSLMDGKHVFGVPVNTLLDLNPMALFVDCMRDVLYGLQFPGWAHLGALTLMTFFTLGLGMWVFQRRSRDVSEEL